MRKTILVLVAAAAIVACSEKQTAQNGSAAAAPAPQQQGQLLPPAQTAAAAQLATPGSQPPVQEAAGQLTGTVLETQDAAGYTYLRIKTKDGERWAAVTQSSVRKGDPATVDVQMMVQNFESKSLKRRFESIAFGTLAGSGGASQGMASSMPSSMPRTMPPPSAIPPMPSAAQHMATPEVANISVPRAEGADAKTIAELWTAKSTLAGQNVTVRGKVVKSLSGIMGKNWLHLRDGSKAGAEDADITVTTDATAAVGDVVTVKGKVSVDRDFGAGYRYAVIIENAEVSKN